MKTKKLFPLKNEIEKEIFGGWSNSSGDNWIDPVEVWGNPGYYDDSNPSDGWGGEPQEGGGAGSSNGPDDSHALKKDIEMCRQASFTAECTYFALGALAKYFNVEGLHKDDFAEHAGVANSIGEALFNIVNDPTAGMSPELFNSVLDDFFVNTSVVDTKGIIQHLDRGEPIVATLINPNSNVGHAVIITGYDSSTNMVTLSNSLVEGITQTMQFDPSLLKDLSAVSGAQDNDIVNKYKNDKNDWWKNCNYSTN